MSLVDVHFSDFFNVDPDVITAYKAFNISLIRDLPLFIDPFLLFNSEDEDYQAMHEGIIQYLRFLRDESVGVHLQLSVIPTWYYFPEVKQTWLGFSKFGNDGRGLGKKFAEALRDNLGALFGDIRQERITKGTHLEKLTLFDTGVGRDMVSDFTTNLIKQHLCKYTQNFARQFLQSNQCKQVSVDKARFNYRTKSWERQVFELPWYRNDFVILCPVDLLTRADNWINRSDLIQNFEMIAQSLPDKQLVAQMNAYLRTAVDPKAASKDRRKQRRRAVEDLLRRYPEILDYYIRHKEDTGDKAHKLSAEHVDEVFGIYVERVSYYSRMLAESTDFYASRDATYAETHTRIQYLKDFIEHKGGHRLFWSQGKPMRREEDVQLLFGLVWNGSPSDVSREVNDGRGPVDYKISRGSQQKTLVEFKLASNSHLKRNLKNQTDVYEKASDAKRSIKVIVFFDNDQQKRVRDILRDLGMQADRDIVLIDARTDNKPSGSRA